MYNEKIDIRETNKEELENVLALWNDGDVMKFVGFPNGFGETMDGMKNWYKHIEEGRPICNHYSIYMSDLGYCGESSYCIDKKHSNLASLDIKLFSKARGKGIATESLSYAIEQAFANGAEKVWVDPNPENAKALALYNRLGFVKKEMPDYLKEIEEDGNFTPVYMELCKTK